MLNRNTNPGLSDLLRMDQQLRQDQNKSLRQLQERDRALGATLPKGSAAKRSSNQKRLLSWLNTVHPGSHGPQKFESALPLGLAAVGFLMGIMAMSGLLLADQQRPVNLLVFLGVFVGLQWLFLLATLFGSLMLSCSDSTSLPGTNLNIIHRLVQRSYQRLSKELRPDQFKPLLRWRMLGWGQMFAVCFNLGLLLTLLLILLVVDRSFGWSSTLDISVDGLHQVLHVLAAPWSWFWPAAGVDMALIEATRYQSLQRQFDAEQVRMMRTWWPFLCAAIAVYGLLPRLLLWGIFHWVYRWQLRLTFVNYPGAGLVLRRMDSPLVHTQASAHEQAQTLGDSVLLRRTLPDGKHSLINWSEALAAQQSSQLGLGKEDVSTAGVHLNDDATLLQRINQQGRDVVILVKSWEPPLSELGDFLRGISPKLTCYLYLLPLPKQSVTPEALADWQHFARQQHHPRLLVVVTDNTAEAAP